MWGNPTLFQQAKCIEKKYYKKINTKKNYLKNVEKRKILTKSIEKSFLIDPLKTNNAIHRP